MKKIINILFSRSPFLTIRFYCSHLQSLEQHYLHRRNLCSRQFQTTFLTRHNTELVYFVSKIVNTSQPSQIGLNSLLLGYGISDIRNDEGRMESDEKESDNYLVYNSLPLRNWTV
jgi:hypothetical protein